MPAAGQSRTRTTSTGTPCSVSTSAASSSSAAPSEPSVSSALSPAEQPAAQLAFLHARQPHDLARIVGAPLHERQRLEHGVVQVRGDLGALVGTDALAPLGDELVHQLPQPGPEDQREPDEHDRRADDAALSARHESTLTKKRPSPAAMHAAPATIRASAPRRVPTSTATASAASGGRRSRNGQSGGSGASSRGRVESTAKPIIAAPNGHTITSPGHGPDRADQQQDAEHDSRRTRSWRSRRSAEPAARRARRREGATSPRRRTARRSRPRASARGSRSARRSRRHRPRRRGPRPRPRRCGRSCRRTKPVRPFEVSPTDDRTAAPRRIRAYPEASVAASGPGSGISPMVARPAERRSIHEHDLLPEPNPRPPSGPAAATRPARRARPPWRFVRRERGNARRRHDRHGRRLRHRRHGRARDLGGRDHRFVRTRHRRVRDLLDRVPERRAPGADRPDPPCDNRSAGYIVGVWYCSASALIIVFGQLFRPFRHGGSIAWATILIGGGLAVLFLRNPDDDDARPAKPSPPRRDARTTTPPTPNRRTRPTPTDDVAPNRHDRAPPPLASDATPPPPDAGPAPPPSRRRRAHGRSRAVAGRAAAPSPPPRRRPFLTPLTLSVLLIGGGVVWLLDNNGTTHFTVAGVLAGGLCVVGLALVLSTWFGRAQGLIPIGDPAARDDARGHDRRADHRRYRRARLQPGRPAPSSVPTTSSASDRLEVDLVGAPTRGPHHAISRPARHRRDDDRRAEHGARRRPRARRRRLNPSSSAARQGGWPQRRPRARRAIRPACCDLDLDLRVGAGHIKCAASTPTAAPSTIFPGFARMTQCIAIPTSARPAVRAGVHDRGRARARDAGHRRRREPARGAPPSG